MRTSDRTFRNVTCLVFPLMISIALAACGSGGGGTTSSGGNASPSVAVSIASAPSYPDGTTFATSTSSPTIAAPPEDSPVFNNLFVTVTKLALIPSTGEDKSVTDPIAPPIQIDLLNLSGDNVATLLNQFSGVPAGEYSKIRVYYDNVVGHTNGVALDTLFHPTANSHFDVHFMGGNLVIPVTSDPGRGIEFYSVLINVVGKYHWAGSSGNVLLRPQVFATVVDGPMKYKVTGVADNVTKDNLAGTFDIHSLDGVRTIPAEFFSGTNWAYSDNVLYGSEMVIGRGASVAVPAFENGAIVSAIGVFDTYGRLQASDITFTFPKVRIGSVFSTWVDNTSFRLNLPMDNLVYAIPDKWNPLYTNFGIPPDILANGYDLIVPGTDNTVKARGYADYPGSIGSGLRAFWISIDNNIGL